MRESRVPTCGSVSQNLHIPRGSACQYSGPVPWQDHDGRQGALLAALTCGNLTYEIAHPKDESLQPCGQHGHHWLLRTLPIHRLLMPSKAALQCPKASRFRVTSNMHMQMTHISPEAYAAVCWIQLCRLLLHAATCNSSLPVCDRHANQRLQDMLQLMWCHG